MTDWIDDTVKALEKDAEKGKQEHERRLLDSKAIQIEIPRVWHRLKGRTD